VEEAATVALPQKQGNFRLTCVPLRRQLPSSEMIIRKVLVMMRRGWFGQETKNKPLRLILMLSSPLRL
jgi:hypothetical protein